jgi:divalent metal cation (Fe/Co/Zn/Cd) transporter
VELTVHVRMPADMTVEESHGISQRMERRILDGLGIVATVHVEPREQPPTKRSRSRSAS